MLRFMLLPLLALTACGSTGNDPPALAEEEEGQVRSYATQLEAPSPDYAALIAGAPSLPEVEVNREASAPPPADARAIGEMWIARLQERGALLGHGLAGKEPDAPVASIDTLLTAEEFDEWVAENGWTAPAHLRWHFQRPLIAPRVSEAALAGVRDWPASSIRTGAQLDAAFGGRIFLRDGCIFVQGQEDGQAEKLAWFHAETGIDVDAQGYYVLIDRVNGQISARLGEMMTWAGPNAVDPNNPDIAAYRAACGDYEVEGVGNPQASERLYVTHPHLRRSPDALPPPDIE